MTDLSNVYEQAPPQRDREALHQTLEALLDGLSRAFGYSRALVALYDNERGVLRGSVAFNLPEEIAEALEVSIEQRDHPLVAALLQASPIRVDDVGGDARLDEHDKALLLEIGISSFVLVPLHSTAQSSSPRSAGPSLAHAPGTRTDPPAGIRQEQTTSLDIPSAGVIL